MEFLFYGPGKSNSFGNSIRTTNHINTIEKIETFINAFTIDQSKHNFEYTDCKVSDICDDQINKKFMTLKEKPEEIGEVLNELKFLLGLNGEILKKLRFKYSFLFNWEFSTDRDNFISIIFYENKIFIQSIYNFPFEVQDEKLYDFINKISKLLPYKLGIKHFKILSKKKSKSGYNLRKITDIELNEKIVSSVVN